MSASIEEVRMLIESAKFHASVYERGALGLTVNCAREVKADGCHGSGFYMLKHKEQWYVVSYAYMVWEIPLGVSPSQMAIDWLGKAETHVLPPDDIVQRYSLHEVDFDDFLSLFGVQLETPNKDWSDENAQP